MRRIVMTVAMPAGIAKAIDGSSLAQEVAYVCRRVWRVARGAVGGVASAGGRARVIIATATDSRTILEACWSPLSGDQC